MAERTKRGWIWTDDEKEDWRNHNHRIRVEAKRASTQVQRFKQSVPSFAPEAAKTSEPLIESFDQLDRIDVRSRGRKYQPISPDEAYNRLEQFDRLLAAWETFMRRADVQKATRQVNREVSAQKRRHQKHRKQVKQRVIAQLATPEFAQGIQEATDFFISELNVLAQCAYDAHDFKGSTDPQFIQTLMHVHFVRNTCTFSPEQKQALRRFVAVCPPPAIGEVIREALFLLAKVSLLSRIESPRFRATLDERVAAIVFETYGSVCRSLDEWQRTDVQLTDLSPGYFQIQGVRFMPVQPSGGKA